MAATRAAPRKPEEAMRPLAPAVGTLEGASGVVGGAS